MGIKIALIGTTSACVIGFRADLIRALVSQGYDVYAFALDYDVNTRLKVREFGAEPVDYCFSRAGLNPLRDIANTIALAAKIREVSPEIVFCYFAKPVIFGTIAAAMAGVKKRIGMLEGLGYVFTKSPKKEGYRIKVIRAIQVMLYRFSFPLLDTLIFLNPDDPVDLMEKNKLKVRKVGVLGGIGLDLNNYPYSNPKYSPVVFIFVGRLLAEKGIHEYIGAARLVKTHHPEAQFVVLGGLDVENPGGLSSLDIEALIEEGLVTYPGHVDDVKDWLANASVFVLPSYREGLPRSTQEAMAIGRAIITTDVPGCRETVEDGVNGFLVKPWVAEDLAEKMIRFIESPELIKKMGIESYRIAQNKYDAAKVNRKIIDYFFEK